MTDLPYRHRPGPVVPRSDLVTGLAYRAATESLREEHRLPRWARVGGHSLWFYYHEEHQRPHLAVRGEHRATVALDTGEILAGQLPPKVHRAVRRFLAVHRKEAQAAWLATQRGQPPDTLS